MGKVTGFLEFKRMDAKYAPVTERVKHWHEFVLPPSEDDAKIQAARCMDCGIPYCHTGCPVNNQIPDWNDLAYRGDWKQARQPPLDQQLPRSDRARVSGAVRGCVHAQYRRHAGHHQDDRGEIADRGFKEGWIVPNRRRRRPASALPSSAPAPPASPRPSSSRAPATTCTSTRGTPSPAASCAMASPTSRWRRASSSGA